MERGELILYELRPNSHKTAEVICQFLGCYHSGTDNKRTTEKGKIELLSQWTKDGLDEQKIFNQSCTLFSGTSPTLTISSTVAIDQNKRTGPGASVL